MGPVPGAKESPQQAGSPSLIWILPLAKAEGPAILYPHYLSLSCMLTSHTYLRTKACTVCTPLAFYLLTSLWLPEEGRTSFLLLVLTPL